MVQQTMRQPPASTVLPVAARVRAWCGAALLVVPAVLTFLCLMVVVGAWRDDVAISAHQGKATAEVVSVSFARTIIRFTTPDGEVRSPRTGVLYPGGVQPGQLVRIEYDIRNPDLARIAGRDVGQGLLPAFLVALGGWVLLAPPAIWLRRTARR